MDQLTLSLTRKPFNLDDYVQSTEKYTGVKIISRTLFVNRVNEKARSLGIIPGSLDYHIRFRTMCKKLGIYQFFTAQHNWFLGCCDAEKKGFKYLIMEDTSARR